MQLVIYGIGKRGKEFIKYIQELKIDKGIKIEIVGVTDTHLDCLEIKSENIKIPFFKVNDILKYKTDYIIITPQNYYKQIKGKLLDLSIEEKKIKSIEEINKELGQSCDGKLYCNLCQNKILEWTYIGYNYLLFSKKDIVGGARRKGRCPICGSSDRERYVYYILKTYTNILSTLDIKILHFAPENMLSKVLKDRYGNDYISADIEPGRGDVIADITNLQFQDGVFDYIICNHVMEHISLEYKAFSELKRCIKQGGTIILTVPICWEEETLEDNSIDTEEKRIQLYGQEDHVRLYGNDIVERIERFGFEVILYRSDQILRKDEIKRMGYIWKDSVLLCKSI